MKGKRGSIVFIIVLLAGIFLLLYPTVADYWNHRIQSRVITDYENRMVEVSPEDCTAAMEEARRYNERLRELPNPLLQYEKVDGYEEALNIAGNSLMGYITIDKIKVQLPIYHGTANSVLNIAAGHLQGSTLPVGGESTHAVLSAHRGLPSAQLFTDLDKMEVGDTFTLKVLDQLLTYEVDQITIIEPEKIEALQIEAGKDYCTLVTCTPYAINTHRLLVRGVRVGNAADKPAIHISSDVLLVDPIITAPLMAVPMLLILFIVLMVGSRKKKGSRRKKE